MPSYLIWGPEVTYDWNGISLIILTYRGLFLTTRSVMYYNRKPKAKRGETSLSQSTRDSNNMLWWRLICWFDDIRCVTHFIGQAKGAMRLPTSRRRTLDYQTIGTVGESWQPILQFETREKMDDFTIQEICGNIMSAMRSLLKLLPLLWR
jgi:hypothetical protein